MIELRIICDGCGKVGMWAQWGGPPAHMMREALKSRGWRRGKNGVCSKEDYCPKCGKRRKKP